MFVGRLCFAGFLPYFPTCTNLPILAFKDLLGIPTSVCAVGNCVCSLLRFVIIMLKCSRHWLSNCPSCPHAVTAICLAFVL